MGLSARKFGRWGVSASGTEIVAGIAEVGVSGEAEDAEGAEGEVQAGESREARERDCDWERDCGGSSVALRSGGV
jgi:hypothetical protein